MDNELRRMNWLFGNQDKGGQEQGQFEPPITSIIPRPQRNEDNLIEPSENRYGKKDLFEVINNSSDREKIKNLDILFTTVLEDIGELLTFTFKKSINTRNEYHYVICYQWDITNFQLDDPFTTPLSKFNMKKINDFWKSKEDIIENLSVSPIGFFLTISKGSSYTECSVTPKKIFNSANNGGAKHKNSIKSEGKFGNTLLLENGYHF